MGAPLLTVFRTAVPVNHTVFCFPIEKLNLNLHSTESPLSVWERKREGAASQKDGRAPGGWNHRSTEVCMKDSMGRGLPYHCH